MANKPDAQLLNNISALAQLGNSIDQAAVVLGMSADALAILLSENDEARSRWAKGGIEAVNQLKVALTRQALAGSVQAAHLLLKMRGEMDEKPQKCAPISSAPTTAPEKARAGRAWRFCSVGDAAQECGVTEKTVQNLVNECKRRAVDGKENPLPVKIGRSGEWQVQPGAVYAWILKRLEMNIVSRKPPHLLVPAGYEDAPAAGETAAAYVGTSAPLGKVDITDFDIDTLKSVLNGDKTNEDKKLYILAFHAKRLQEDSEEKRLAKIPREDVVKLMKSCGEVYMSTIEDTAAAKAADLLRYVREQFQVNLAEVNCSAVQILTSFFCDQSNRLEIPAIRKCVRDAVDGVEVLEGVA